MASFNFTRVLAQDFGFLARTAPTRGADRASNFKAGDTVHLYYGVPKQARIGTYKLLSTDDVGSHFNKAGTENSVEVDTDSDLVEVRKGSELEKLLDRTKAYAKDPEFDSYIGFALERIESDDAPHITQAFGRGQSTVICLDDGKA